MVLEFDVIVVGGGVVGASITFQLSKSGKKVLMLERGEIGGQASSAASGTLDSHFPELGRDFMEESMSTFLHVADEIENLTGIDVEVEKSGELVLSFDEQSSEEFFHMNEKCRDMCCGSEWLTTSQIHNLEPEVSDNVLGAIYRPNTSRVNNQRLSEAFSRASTFYNSSVEIGSEVIGIDNSDRETVKVTTRSGIFYSSKLIIAAGAWTPSLLTNLKVDIPVRPIKGQNLNLSPDFQKVQTVVKGNSGVIVPRNDGSVMAGVTQEDKGFDNRVTADGIKSIMNEITSIMPALGNATFNWAISGLRPAASDGLPIIDFIPGSDRIIVAAGHYMWGIFLSPITGVIVNKMLDTGNNPMIDVLGLNRGTLTK